MFPTYKLGNKQFQSIGENFSNDFITYISQRNRVIIRNSFEIILFKDYSLKIRVMKVKLQDLGKRVVRKK